MLKRIAQQAAVAAAPAIYKLKGGKALDAISSYLHVLAGQGAGSGWDATETAVAASLVQGDHPVIFDVGANNGEWSRALAGRLKRPAAFHLFECAPLFVEPLAKVTKDIEGSIHVNTAVSDRSGTAVLHYPAQAGVGGGLGSLHARSDVCVPQIDYAQLEVPTLRLDDYADQNGISRIALLKLDIEGHELSALQGAERLFQNRQVAAIMFEFGSANVNSRTFFRDFWNFLTAHGFELSRIVPGGRCQPVPRYSETLEYFRGATNYVARLSPRAVSP